MPVPVGSTSASGSPATWSRAHAEALRRLHAPPYKTMLSVLKDNILNHHACIASSLTTKLTTRYGHSCGRCRARGPARS